MSKALKEARKNIVKNENIKREATIAVGESNSIEKNKEIGERLYNKALFSLKKNNKKRKKYFFTMIGGK